MKYYEHMALCNVITTQLFINFYEMVMEQNLQVTGILRRAQRSQACCTEVKGHRHAAQRSKVTGMLHA